MKMINNCNHMSQNSMTIFCNIDITDKSTGRYRTCKITTPSPTTRAVSPKKTFYLQVTQAFRSRTRRRRLLARPSGPKQQPCWLTKWNSITKIRNFKDALQSVDCMRVLINGISSCIYITNYIAFVVFTFRVPWSYSAD